MVEDRLIIDGITYCKRDIVNSKIKKAIDDFFRKIKHNIDSDDLVVSAVRDYSIIAGDDNTRIIKKINSRISRLNRNKEKIKDKRIEKEKDILEFLKKLYLEWDSSQINKFRGCLFEKIVEHYVDMPKKIFGAGIIKNPNEEKIQLVKHTCSKKEKERVNIFFEEIGSKGKLNNENREEIKKRSNNIKTTRETCDIIVEKEKRLYLVEIKLNPMGFDCFSTSTLVTMGEYLDSKGIKDFSLVCLSTWSNEKVNETFKLNIKECDNKCLTKKLEKQKMSLEDRFSILGFYGIMEILKEKNKKTA